MLYKKMLRQISRENDKFCEEHYKILDVEREICRTQGLNIDESLTNFAKQNREIMKSLILMECEDFQRPFVKRLLTEAEKHIEPWERKPDINYITNLSRAKSAVTRRKT